MCKRLIATLMAVILLVAMLAGCGAKQVSNSNVTKITMWSSDSHSKLVMEKLVNEFNRTIGKENDIEFEYIIKENDLTSTTDKEAYRFLGLLEKGGLSATLRRRMGEDIDGACGQLRQRYIEENQL